MNSFRSDYAVKGLTVPSGLAPLALDRALASTFCWSRRLVSLQFLESKNHGINEKIKSKPYRSVYTVDSKTHDIT
jgi:hypothetical protein